MEDPLLNKFGTVAGGTAEALSAQRGTSSGRPNSLAQLQYSPHPSLLMDLRRFLSNPGAAFNTPGQAEALEVSVNRAENMLLIEPTAMGKSLVYMMPAAFYDSELVTIVILPHSLYSDFQHQCQKFNISSSQWIPPPSKPQATKLIFVAPEHAQERTFYEFVIGLNLANKLARIVIDEPYFILQNFHSCLSNLKCFSAVGVFFFHFPCYLYTKFLNRCLFLTNNSSLPTTTLQFPHKITQPS